MLDLLYPRTVNAGEAAFAVEFGNEISLELNRKATALAALLEREPFQGYREAVPTFRSVLVFHDPEADPDAIRAHALELARRAGGEPEPEPRLLEIPCVYDGEDLRDVAAQIGVSVEELIRIHSGRDYRVYIIGFTPGFPYLGMADPRLDIPRRPVPRVRVPAGAVAMARAQTGIYPWVTPGGWHLLGRMDPALLFDPGKSPPSGCVPGDQVRFLPVTELPERPAAETPAPPPPEGPPACEVERGGLLTTVQDLGRPGCQRYGVPWSGAADPASLIFANRAVGNPDGAAGLECTLLGPVLRFLQPVLAALGGADHRAVLHLPGGGRWQVPVGTSFLAPAGSVLRFAGPPGGMRAYLAFAGGIEVPEVLGSRATYLTAALGGFEGRALRPGDRLHVGAAPAGARENRYEPGARRTAETGPLRLRISLGPQEDCFTEAVPGDAGRAALHGLERLEPDGRPARRPHPRTPRGDEGDRLRRQPARDDPGAPGRPPHRHGRRSGHHRRLPEDRERGRPRSRPPGPGAPGRRGGSGHRLAGRGPRDHARESGPIAGGTELRAGGDLASTT